MVNLYTESILGTGLLSGRSTGHHAVTLTLRFLTLKATFFKKKEKQQLFDTAELPQNDPPLT